MRMREKKGVWACFIAALFMCSLLVFSACGETHEHYFVDGKCECGAIDETYTPPKDYFVGNVFQIVTETLGKQPYMLGSGVVINQDGWFITNSHVMEGAYYAYAYFEIPNAEQGDSVTKLQISEAAVNNRNKDFFIGKIEGYETISSYYKQIDFTTNHEIGGITFSVGYPNGTPFMEIHRGVELAEVPYFPDKLNGVSYIGTTSYFESGSSGGILLNDELQIIGLTTAQIKVDDEWVKAAVSVFNFQNELSQIPQHTLYNFTDFMNPTEKEYIDFFEKVENNPDYTGAVGDDGVVGYILIDQDEGINNENLSYSYESIYLFDSAGYMSINSDYYWADGTRRTLALYGYWSPMVGFENFIFEFKFTFDDGRYLKVESTDINYSENIDLTLNNYTTDKSYSYTITEENIIYVKQQFNLIYTEMLYVFENGLTF